jgi:hypothetical protein
LIAKAFLSWKIAETGYYHLFFTQNSFDSQKFEAFVKKIVEKNLLLDQRWIKEIFISQENIDNILSLGSDFRFSWEFLNLLRNFSSQFSQYPTKDISHSKQCIADYINNKMNYTIEVEQFIETMRKYVTQLITTQKK